MAPLSPARLQVKILLNNERDERLLTSEDNGRIYGEGTKNTFV